MSRRSERLAAQSALERAWQADQAERPAPEPVTRTPQPTCPGRFDRTCLYFRNRDGLYRCCWCSQLSPNSVARLAARQKGGE
jgi:hypothetical protein